MATTITEEKIQFESDGIKLVGILYKPSNFKFDKKYPAVVTGGSLTSVKEQMAGTYAKKLAELGIIALAFDYRNYGESEGQPRQYEDPEIKLKGITPAKLQYLYIIDFKLVGFGIILALAQLYQKKNICHQKTQQAL